jgi:hypothetical protein
MDSSPAIAKVDRAVQLFFSSLQIAYPLIVLFVYLIAFTVRSITTARSNDNDDSAPPTTAVGPGGKPLPKHTKTVKGLSKDESVDFTKPQKLLFQWLTVGVTFTFIGNIIVVLTHALYARKEGWWCGQAPTVRL